MGEKQVKQLDWLLTPWTIADGRWKIPPVIIIEGHTPFFADTPEGYIEKLQQMHDDPNIARGAFYTYIGQLKDLIDQS